MANPSYVRLNDRAARGSLADIGGSGWSISGNDVQEYPEDPDEAKFVRLKLRQGILEEASRSEYDEAHPSSDGEEVPRIVMVQDKTPHQEAQVAAAAKAQARKLREARARQTSALHDEDYDPDAIDTPGVPGGVRRGDGDNQVQGGFVRPGKPSAGEEDYQKVARAARESDDEDGEVPVSRMNKTQLQALARELDLDDSGTVAELRDRIGEYTSEGEDDEDE